jgi:hypothetical protein
MYTSNVQPLHCYLSVWGVLLNRSSRLMTVLLACTAALASLVRSAPGFADPAHGVSHFKFHLAWPLLAPVTSLFQILPRIAS